MSSLAVSSTESESTHARLLGRPDLTAEEQVVALMAGARTRQWIRRELGDPATIWGLSWARRIEISGRATWEAVADHRAARALAIGWGNAPHEMP